MEKTKAGPTEQTSATPMAEQTVANWAGPMAVRWVVQMARSSADPKAAMKADLMEHPSVAQLELQSADHLADLTAEMSVTP